MVSKRRRLGVAVLLEPPVSDEVDGLRRALGDPSLGRIAPHVTLVPPVNVRSDDLPLALSRLRAAAAAVEGPIVVTLGPVMTFMPANPVLYLSVGGDIESLQLLRDRVFAAPLERPLSWPWVPHLTVADGIEVDRVEPAMAVLGRYAAMATIDRVVLLEERAERTWEPLADAVLGPAARIGTGGLALEISGATMFDPEVKDLFSECQSSLPSPGEGGRYGPVIRSARRDNRVVGVAAAWTEPLGGHIAVLVAPDVRRQGIGGHLLAHLELALRRAEWPYHSLDALGPVGFYRQRSRWSVAPPVD